MTLHNRISQELLRLHVPANLKGFDLLARAVELTIYSGDYTQSFYKSICPTLAEENGTKTASIVRTISYSMSSALEHQETLNALGMDDCQGDRSFITRLVAVVARAVEQDKETIIDWPIQGANRVDPYRTIKRLREQLERTEAEKAEAVRLLQSVVESTGRCEGCKFYDEQTCRCTDSEKSYPCGCGGESMWAWKGEE